MAAPPALDGVTHDWIDAGGVRFHVAFAGAGDPVVLLHGWPQHWWCWRELVPRLGDRYRLVMPDLRGFGWSSTPAGGFHPSVFARDVVALLDVLGIERAWVVGHDWGGFTAQVLAISSPSRVRGVLALAAPHRWVVPGAGFGRAWRSWYAAVLAAPVVGHRLAPRMVRWGLWRGGRRWLFDPDAVAIYSSTARGAAVSALYRSYWRVAWESATGRSHGERINVPVRLLVGGEEPYFPTEWITAFARSPGPDVVAGVVPGAGHFLPEEVPDAVASAFGSLVSNGAARTT